MALKENLCYLYFSISNENYAFFTVLNKKLGEYVLGWVIMYHISVFQHFHN